MPDNPTRPPAEGSDLVSRPQEASTPDNSKEPELDMQTETYGNGSETPSRDRMAIAGFVCSLCVPVITLMLIPLDRLSATSRTASFVSAFLLPAGAVLWTTGLILSLKASNKAPRHHKLAGAGTIISVICPMLFIAVLFLLLVSSPTEGTDAAASRGLRLEKTWEREMPASAGGGVVIVSSTVAEGLIYASTHDGGTVWALDIRTGEIAWTFETDRGRRPPTYSDGVVHVFGSGSHFALDGMTGRVLWTRDNLGASAIGDGRLYHATVVDDVTTLQALESTTGRELWVREPPSSPLPIMRFPLIADDANVYLSDDHVFHVIDASSGAMRWTAAVAAGSPPRAAGEAVYVMAIDDPESRGERPHPCEPGTEAAWCAYAFDQRTGELLWSYRPPISGVRSYLAPPTVVNGTWLIPADELQALDAATGDLLWSVPLNVLALAAFDGHGHVYASALDGELHALDIHTGESVWSIPYVEGATNKMTLQSGVLWVHTIDHYLWAVGATADSWGRTDATFIGGDHRVFAVSDRTAYVGYQHGESSGVRAYTLTPRDESKEASQ